MKQGNKESKKANTFVNKTKVMTFINEEGDSIFDEPKVSIIRHKIVKPEKDKSASDKKTK